MTKPSSRHEDLINPTDELNATPTDQEWDNWFLRPYGTDPKYKIFIDRSLLRALGRTRGLFLHDLKTICWGEDATIVRKRKRPYGLCTTKMLTELGGWSINEQKKYIRFLKDADLIYCIYRGIPAQRYISINVVRMNRLMDLHEDRS